MVQDGTAPSSRMDGPRGPTDQTWPSRTTSRAAVSGGPIFFLPLLIINESSSCSDSSLSPGGHRVQVFKVQVSSSSGCSGCL